MSDSLFEICAVHACTKPVVLTGDVCDGCKAAFGPMLRAGETYRACSYGTCEMPAIPGWKQCAEHHERAEKIWALILDPALRERSRAMGRVDA